MNIFVCEHCLETFKTSTSLLKHQRTSKICLTYRDIIFVCKKCRYSTIGIKNIKFHMTNTKCDCVNITVETDDINEYIIEELNDDVENHIPTVEEINIQKRLLKAENDLKKERIKSTLYKQIIEKNTNIKLDSCQVEEINIPSTNISINNNIVKTPTNLDEKEFPQIDTDNKSVDDIEQKQAKSQYKTYKIVKNLDTVPETDKIIIDKRIREIDQSDYIKLQQFNDIEQCKMIFKEQIDSIRTGRTYTKNLEILKTTRRKLFGSIHIDEYICLLQTQIKSIKNILESKGHQDKRIPPIISKCLNTIDMRLIQYGNYYDIALDTDEYFNLKTCLELFPKNPKYYVPFVFNDFIKKFYNYGSVIIPLKNCIEMYIINRYEFNNIIYLPLKQSLEQDPYSFYILEGVVKDKRFWKMDCRLVDFTDSLIVNLRQYLINVFRHIYQNIFNDNDYRDDFSTKTILLETDGKQLLQNIFMLCNPKHIYNQVREVIVRKSTHMPTENDRFNLYGDDIVIKKRFLNNKDNTDVVELVKLLFDNITYESAVDLYRNFNIK